MDSYKTVEKTTESEIVIERSRFITMVAPCAAEDAARAILLERKKQHYSATHNCYAYITDNGKYGKFSDDGEPGGTAGQPILSAIQNAGIFDVQLLFPDVMTPGQEYDEDTLLKEIFAKANIIKPKICQEVIAKAVQEKVILESRSALNGKKVYLLPITANEQTLPF